MGASVNTVLQASQSSASVNTIIEAAAVVASPSLGKKVDCKPSDAQEQQKALPINETSSSDADSTLQEFSPKITGRKKKAKQGQSKKETSDESGASPSVEEKQAAPIKEQAKENKLVSKIIPGYREKDEDLVEEYKEETSDDKDKNSKSTDYSEKKLDVSSEAINSSKIISAEKRKRSRDKKKRKNLPKE